ncbi:USP domain-containing protein [Mycena kentingensis (nom. inval.)]|nr:USP domain-containing protein [Mycena kentingensis (nom. inval.)]
MRATSTFTLLTIVSLLAVGGVEARNQRRSTCRAPAKVHTKEQEPKQACKGSCSVRHKQDKKKNLGAAKLTVTGGTHAVSDLTTAGGWTILACDEDALEQQVRLVCSSTDCEHLFEGHGAVDTVVRLPESCGASAFARVADLRLDPDQTVPEDVQAKLKEQTQAGNMTSTVFIASIDTNWAAVNSTRTGEVEFSLEGYNFDPPDMDASETPVANSTTEQRRRALQERNWTAFNKTKSIDLSPIKISQEFPLFTASVDCKDGLAGFSASVSAGFSTNIETDISIGIIAAGTFIPPKIKQLATFTELDGKIEGKLDLKAAATGSISTGKVPLFAQPLGSINFPGIFQLGPTFSIYGKIDAALEAEVDVSVDLAYTANSARIYFPAEAAPCAGEINPVDTALSLSVAPTLSASSTVTAHLIPEIKLGLSAFTFVKAEVYLEADASASLSLEVDASASAGVSVNTTVEGTATESHAGTQVSGRVGIDAAFGVNVGASGSFFGLIDASKEASLFSDEWKLLERTFEAHAGVATSPRRALVLGRDVQFTCPSLATGESILQELEEIFSEVVKPVLKN